MIETRRLILRRYREDDLPLLHALMSDPKVMRYYAGANTQQQSERALSNAIASYEKRGYSVFAAEQKSDGSFIGHVGLLHWDDVDDRPDVEVAYMLLPSYWGKGYATEAARACRDWAFERLGIDRVVSFIVVENLPSIAVAERNGMTRLKRLDENRFEQPIYVYAIARERWSLQRVERPVGRADEEYPAIDRGRAGDRPE